MALMNREYSKYYEIAVEVPEHGKGQEYRVGGHMISTSVGSIVFSGKAAFWEVMNRDITDTGHTDDQHEVRIDPGKYLVKLEEL